MNTVNLGNPELLGIAAVLGALRWLVPAISHEYRKHIDWRDKRKRRQVREISTRLAHYRHDHQTIGMNVSSAQHAPRQD